MWRKRGFLMRTRIIGVCVFVVILGTLTWWRSVRSGANPALFRQSLPMAQPAQNNDRQVAAQPAPPPAREAPVQSASDFAVAEKFFGTWTFQQYGSPQFFKVSKAGSRIRFELLQKYNGKMSPLATGVRGADGIYLGVANAQLSGEFVSWNFYATHGEEFTYRVTLAAEGDDKLSYSVYCSIRGGETEKFEATKSVEG